MHENNIYTVISIVTSAVVCLSHCPGWYCLLPLSSMQIFFQSSSHLLIRSLSAGIKFIGGGLVVRKYFFEIAYFKSAVASVNFALIFVNKCIMLLFGIAYLRC